MNPYVICADSACDMNEAILRDWGVDNASLRFRFEGEAAEYNNNQLPATEFYKKMREGGIAKTSAVNVEDFKSLFQMRHLRFLLNSTIECVKWQVLF